MPLPDNYWENQSQKKIEPTPQRQADLESPAPPGYTEEEISGNLDEAKEKAHTESLLRQTQRPAISYIPYIAMNELYNMPKESMWNVMSMTEKVSHVNKENTKLAWRMFKGTPKFVGKFIYGIPKHIATAYPKIAQSAYDLTTGAIAAIDKKSSWTEVQKQIGHDESFTLPALGEIRGFKGSYDEGIDMGIGRFGSAIKATGETAGDVAMALTGIDFAGFARKALFSPRMVKIKGSPRVTGDAYRPLTAEKVDQIVKASANKITAGEVYEAVKKNPNIYYTPLPKEASKLWGIPGNAFAKITPKSKDLAELTFVQQKKSLYAATKDAFARKLGRSRVIEGEFGPEIKLHSQIIKYNSEALVPKGTATVAATRPVRDLTAVSIAEPTQVIKSLEGQLRQTYKAQATQVSQALGEIQQELTLAEAGKRVLTREEGGIVEGVTAQRSTFPDWIPEDLRSKALLDKVVDSLEIDKLSYPAGIQTRVRRLYDAILDRVDDVTGIDTRQIRESINDNFIRSAEEKAVAKVPAIPEELQSLAVEARKYKSAEEFVEKGDLIKTPNILWRGMSVEGVTELKVGSGNLGAGIYLTDSPRAAQAWAGGWEGGIHPADLMEVTPSQIYQVKVKTENLYKPKETDPIDDASFIAGIKEQGYDGITTAEETVIFDPKNVSIEGTLDDFYKQAVGVVKSEERLAVEGADPFYKLREEIAKKPLPSIMAQPLKGFGDKLITEKQIGQVVNLAKDRELDDIVIQAISSAFNGKENIYELTQNELYDVSEAIRAFPEKFKPDPVYDFNTSLDLSSWIKLNADWMSMVEQRAMQKGYNYPIDSEVRIPIETGIRLTRIHRDLQGSQFRGLLGKYTSVKYAAERRLLSEYTKGNKDVILKNDSLSKQTIKELSEFGDWARKYLDESFKKEELGLTYSRWVGTYLPEIRKKGGIQLLYKETEIPPELKVFAQFEREGQLNVLEDDILVLLDTYASAVGRIKFLKKPYDHATSIIEGLPQHIQKATSDVVQEMMGRRDELEKGLIEFGRKLSKQSGGIIPEDISSQATNLMMTNSYAGALGLPRFMPPVRNLVDQSLIFPYAEFGPKYYAKGFRWLTPAGFKEIKDRGFDVKSGVIYGEELSEQMGRGGIGKAVDWYKRVGLYSLKPYGFSDTANRVTTMGRVIDRFDDHWTLFKNGQINYNEFSAGIDMQGFTPTVQNVLSSLFQKNTKDSLFEAQELMIKETIDRIQYGMRKGAGSRLHHGLRGKAIGQFSLYTWGYVSMLKGWVVRKQWDKLIRFLGMVEASKRAMADAAGIDVSKWIGMGPIQIPISPLMRIASLTGSGIEAALDHYDKELNSNFKEIKRSLGIFGGVITGAGAQRWKKVFSAMEEYEKSPFPLIGMDPEEKFALRAASGKLIRPVDFKGLLLYGFGFETIEGQKEFDALDVIHKGDAEKKIVENKAMDHFIKGDFEKFQDMYIDNQLDFNPADRMDSYQKSILHRVFERMGPRDKMKYYNLIAPIIYEQE